ncbi:MAG: Ni/Fe hydrogenase subunit alpha [Gammaproteobacteria bacterium]|nr:Ni/Fe hydrogenase subunit alpha [Gammaproteobacteria bacterium]
MPTPGESREIAVDYLARVEGEGAMYLKIEGDQVKDVRFNIFEPPRFYEAVLRGRHFAEAPDITARICGICPVAYQTSSVNAMEHAAGVSVGGQIRNLRKLLYFGEWIESHSLHVYMLHTPDFLGYPSAIEMAADLPEVVTNALRLKKLGNDIMTAVGGREIHPINVRVGGFYRAPTKRELRNLVDELQWATETAEETVSLVAGFEFPDFDMDYEFVALYHPDEYAITDGRIISNRGLDIDVAEWRDHFEESHVEWSNALHARIKDRGRYLVGPMARFALSGEQLAPRAKEAAAAVGLTPGVSNPFKSIIVRAVEIVHACDEALRIINAYEPPETPFVTVEPRSAIGHGASEAPRGLLYHRYEIDAGGLITDAQIVPPTSQNQASIEEDLRKFVPGRTHLDDDTLQWQLEQAIRNYDPCISCATHFLDLTVERVGDTWRAD